MTPVTKLLARKKALVGMVHVHALPGTPRGGMAIEEIKQRAVDDAKILADAGFDALIIENMHDVPYLRRNVGPEIVASMTAIGAAVRAAVDLRIGVQILAGANREALAVALAIGGSFIRAEGFIFAAVADEGLLDEADAGPLLRYRKMIGADDIAILADIKKKHSSHAITADVDLAATAKAAVFCGADGLIVTGPATGEEASIEDVQRVCEAAGGAAVLVGSGVRPDNAPALLEHADALIVGSFLKREGIWSNPIDLERARALRRVVKPG
jgi:membrane complex biogenesis BtpA family protein